MRLSERRLHCQERPPHRSTSIRRVCRWWIHLPRYQAPIVIQCRECFTSRWTIRKSEKVEELQRSLWATLSTPTGWLVAWWDDLSITRRTNERRSSDGSGDAERFTEWLTSDSIDWRDRRDVIFHSKERERNDTWNVWQSYSSREEESRGTSSLSPSRCTHVDSLKCKIENMVQWSWRWEAKGRERLFSSATVLPNILVSWWVCEKLNDFYRNFRRSSIHSAGNRLCMSLICVGWQLFHYSMCATKPQNVGSVDCAWARKLKCLRRVHSVSFLSNHYSALIAGDFFPKTRVPVEDTSGRVAVVYRWNNGSNDHWLSPHHTLIQSIKSTVNWGDSWSVNEETLASRVLVR